METHTHTNTHTHTHTHKHTNTHTHTQEHAYIAVRWQKLTEITTEKVFNDVPFLTISNE